MVGIEQVNWTKIDTKATVTDMENKYEGITQIEQMAA